MGGRAAEPATRRLINGAQGDSTVSTRFSTQRKTIIINRPPAATHSFVRSQLCSHPPPPIGGFFFVSCATSAAGEVSEATSVGMSTYEMGLVNLL